MATLTKEFYFKTTNKAETNSDDSVENLLHKKDHCKRQLKYLMKNKNVNLYNNHKSTLLSTSASCSAQKISCFV